MKKILKSLVNGPLSLIGYQITRAPKPEISRPSEEISEDKAEGFPNYLRQARLAGLDVNDWIEQELGWLPALPILEETKMLAIKQDAVVCELGPGTGRWSRHFASLVTHGELHLVDHSPWIIQFLQTYFRENPRVHCYVGNGASLPFAQDGWLDCIFCQGTFIELKLGKILLYAQEFRRVLKPGGFCVFDFIDPDTSGGWTYLQEKSITSSDTFTYHTLSTIEKVFSSLGFAIEDSHHIGKSTYLKVRKSPFNLVDTE